MELIQKKKTKSTPEIFLDLDMGRLDKNYYDRVYRFCNDDNSYFDINYLGGHIKCPYK